MSRGAPGLASISRSPAGAAILRAAGWQTVLVMGTSHLSQEGSGCAHCSPSCFLAAFVPQPPAPLSFHVCANSPPPELLSLPPPNSTKHSA